MTSPENIQPLAMAQRTICPDSTAVSWAINVKASIHASSKAVLVYLAWWMDRGIHPSVNVLAEQAQVSTKTVERALAELRCAGLVSSERKGGNSAFRARNRYVLIGHDAGECGL